MATYSSEPAEDYLIFRPERLGAFDLLRLLFSRRELTDHRFVESGTRTAYELRNVRADWVLVLVAIIQKILAAISVPLKWLGIVVEFFLNFMSLNGGLFGLIKRIITGKVVIPKRGAANFRSIIAHIDGRVNLYGQTSLISSFPRLDTQFDQGGLNLLDLTMMAAKIVYENEAYVKDAINNKLKFYFVEFFDCWNKFLHEKTTQAFIFCDKPEDASWICVAFRGTEPFNAQDWSTDVDLGYIRVNEKMGRIHQGFAKALGLQDETDFANGFPADVQPNVDQPLAYYAVRQSLTTLLAKHPNAKVLITGHSLGAALACLFPALLLYHGKNDILGRVMGVVTHAQPRVGDVTFATYMEKFTASLNYLRVVYRYDVVPRVPFDKPPLALFRHFGTCHYYRSWHQAREVSEVPNPNYFDPLYVVPMYWNAWGDLIKALFIGRTQGKDFKEGWVSILFRVTGLFIPGIASHSPRDYVNGARLAKMAAKDIV